ncbi:MAG: RluA family pseudouridine synthase [Oscillospiraceae bacterium]|jgi:23S rRNA pseudouridine1911/1915/1917 synthase|nr:RluA family pseudouridine synthase [Oscillospiraceae bacterium]
MKEKFELKVHETDANTRIDKFLAFYFSKLSEERKELSCITRSRIQKILDEREIFIDNKNDFRKNYKLKTGNIISFCLQETENKTLVAQDIKLDIIYEDNDLLVVNKPQEMVVHPAPGHYDGTLANALFYHCKGNLSSVSGALRLGIVHRIDKDTSGLLVVAKNNFAHINLAEQIRRHTFLRQYEAVVHFPFRVFSGKIEIPIGRDAKDRKKMAATFKNSKEAITYYEVLKNFEKFSHVRLVLKTGRTHQIRVHMSKIGHPLIGDKLYGYKTKKDKELSGQCLHAKTISFVHPRTGKFFKFSSPLPEYFGIFLKSIRK